jgi:dTDP-glucose 4,6-dehydratase
MLHAEKLLVTGGAGFIGSSFVGQMVQAGKQVIVLDALTYAGHPANLEWINRQGWKGSYTLVKGRIEDGKHTLELLRKYEIDAVLNFAAESHVDNSISKPSEFIETNIVGVYNMLEASREYYRGLAGDKKQNFRFLQVSTDEVYGSLGETGYFTETTAMKPNSPYSASKAAGDHLVRAWFKTYGLPCLTTNCTNNYGPRQYPEKLIPLVITRAVAGQSLPIYGDGKNIRDWIQVEDHCRGVALALEKGVPGQVYAFGGNAERTNLEVVHAICEILDEIRPRKDSLSYKSQIAFVPDRPGHDRRYAIDDSKAQKELGFTREYSFESGLRATVEWYLANQEWADTVTGKTKEPVKIAAGLQFNI